jgi:hypothetical protein
VFSVTKLLSLNTKEPMLKRILKITSIILLVLVVAAFAAPYIFKDKITAFVKKEINDNLNAKVDFKSV